MAERPLSRQRPYLLRAMHEWMTDNALTPHIVIDASLARLDLPPEQVRDNRTVLNISYAATRGLVIGSDAVSFEARFNGVPRALHVEDLPDGVHPVEVEVVQAVLGNEAPRSRDPCGAGSVHARSCRVRR